MYIPPDPSQCIVTQCHVYGLELRVWPDIFIRAVLCELYLFLPPLKVNGLLWVDGGATLELYVVTYLLPKYAPCS